MVPQPLPRSIDRASTPQRDVNANNAAAHAQRDPGTKKVASDIATSRIAWLGCW